MKLINQIVEVLRESKKAQHVDDIADLLVSKYPNLPIPRDELANKVAGLLSRDVRVNRKESKFAKIKNKQGGNKRGYYKLREYRLAQRNKVPMAVQPKVTNLYTGKAGEFAVISELLFFGFNASGMTVDDGIDIVASKDNRFFHIQVKTANVSESGKYTFTLAERAFLSVNSTSVFYILVMREHIQGRYINTFLVVPNTEIERLVDTAAISKGEKMSLRIERSKTGSLVLNGAVVMDNWVNRFNAIK